MTPFGESIALIHLTLNAMVLWFVWQVPWRRAGQERYRQQLFAVRDKLFDLARSGEIAFTDPAYVALRSHINGMIRYSHLFSVTRLATFIMLRRYIGDQGGPSLTSALSQIKGKKAKADLREIYAEVGRHTLRCLLFSSPHILLAGPVVMLLDRLINKPKSRPTLTPLHRPATVVLIEMQARAAYKSETIKRRHDSELASVELVG